MNPSPLLQVDGISKRFGTTAALTFISLELFPGEVHALVGENGAGKSTLMKILAGAERPDTGRILWQGRPFIPREPIDALRAGISMIYQEFNLAPHLTVRANLTLGREQPIAGVILREGLLGIDQSRQCREALAMLGVEIPLDTRVRDLGVADQQLLEIARAIMSGARLIIMDEPTSALAIHEVQRLFSVISQLRAKGIAIVYISHFLEEVSKISDRITVLRDGRNVATGMTAEWNEKRIIQAMVGREVSEMYPRTPHALGEPILRVDDLIGKPLPRAASLTLHRGEILGIAGLVGAGRTEMLRTLFGLDPRSSGRATFNGAMIQRFSPADWNVRGIGLLSEDRKNEGLAQSLSCVSNIALPALSRASRLGWVLGARQRASARELGKTLAIRWAGPEQRVSNLSGGNQQKVALARLLYTDADVLLLDEPTRGIDVAAKVDLYRTIGALAARGKAVLMVSSYLPELFGTCDRIAVMSRGRLSTPRDVETLTPESVMQMAVA